LAAQPTKPNESIAIPIFQRIPFLQIPPGS
jgi:hypothetical protein